MTTSYIISFLYTRDQKMTVVNMKCEHEYTEYIFCNSFFGIALAS